MKYIPFYGTTINRIPAIGNVLVRYIAIYLVCDGVKAELLCFQEECCIDIRAGKLLIHFGPTFLWKNHSASIYLIHFKFGTVKDIFMLNVSIVLEFLFFVFLAGK